MIIILLLTAVKAAMNSYKHTASNENKEEFFRKFYNYLVAKRYEAAMSELEELTRDFNATSDELKVIHCESCT